MNAVRSPYRSKFQEAIAELLDERGVAYTHEGEAIEYRKPERTAKYTPPFALCTGIILQQKGRFVTADRQKHILIKQQFPNREVRFIFWDAQARISKLSDTTYAAWCDRYGFTWTCYKANRKAKLPVVPLEWTRNAVLEQNPQGPIPFPLPLRS